MICAAIFFNPACGGKKASKKGAEPTANEPSGGTPEATPTASPTVTPSPAAPGDSAAATASPSTVVASDPVFDKYCHVILNKEIKRVIGTAKPDTRYLIARFISTPFAKEIRIHVKGEPPFTNFYGEMGIKEEDIKTINCDNWKERAAKFTMAPSLLILGDLDLYADRNFSGPVLCSLKKGDHFAENGSIGYDSSQQGLYHVVGKVLASQCGGKTEGFSKTQPEYVWSVMPIKE
jgi:hypothetical protein